MKEAFQASALAGQTLAHNQSRHPTEVEGVLEEGGEEVLGLAKGLALHRVQPLCRATSAANGCGKFGVPALAGGGWESSRGMGFFGRVAA